MSIYAKFDGKSYKLPDALTIGRGEPFDVLDRTLARAHARLVFKGGKWKIKDLSSDCGIMINGNKIRPGKFLSIHPGDKILLGNVPFEIFESLPDGICREVQNFTVHDITDFSPYIYGPLFLLGGIVAFGQSQGDFADDIIFLAIIAAFLKLASVVTRVVKTVYFPMKVVLETNLTDFGVTFHITGKQNFTLKFEDVSKWYIVGKCFFISAYGKNLIYLLNEGHEELANSLREHCHKKRVIGEPILEKLALLPFFFVLSAWLILYVSDERFFQFLGHGIGFLGIAGLLAFFFSEHLRELLPFPRQIPGMKIAFTMGTIAAVTMVMQFGKFQSHYKLTKAKVSLLQCRQSKTCGKADFRSLIGRKLSDEHKMALEGICKEGNLTACSKSERKPASR